MKAVFDTNILIDYLNGHAASKKELGLYDQPLISLVTWGEVLVGAKSLEEEQQLKQFLKRFILYPISKDIMGIAVQLRREYRMRLPDAIIWATAHHEESILVTRNTKDFSETHPTVRVPY